MGRVSSHFRLKLLAVSAASAVLVGPASAEEPNWYWLEECGGPILRLDLRLDGVGVHEVAVPLCKRLRSVKPDRPFTALTFKFVANRAIEWLGHRDDSNVTPAGAELWVDIWQAGADESGVILGLTVEFEKTLYMNTLHVASPDKTSEQAIEPGLVLRTQPVESSERAP